MNEQISIEETIVAVFNPPRHEFNDIKSQFMFKTNKGGGDCLFYSAVECGLFIDHLTARLMVCDRLDEKFYDWYLRSVVDDSFRTITLAEITAEAKEMHKSI